MGIKFSSLPPKDWRLDVAGILAILGEKNIQLNAILITSDRLCYLPRLLPAPQGLLSGKRLKKLPEEEDIQVMAVHSGNKADGLNYFATLLHNHFIESPRFLVQKAVISTVYSNQEIGFSRKFWSPVNVITISSFALSVALMALAIAVRDGIGCLAVLIMSLTSSFISAAGHWEPVLPDSNQRSIIPPGDVVIRKANGSFLVVQCDDLTARRLYFNKEELRYTFDPASARAMGGLAGGLGLTLGVILFGNSQWPTQLATAISYGILNVLYWAASVCPPSWSWDFSNLNVKLIGNNVLPSDNVADEDTPKQRRNYTGALAAAIHMARSASWVHSFPGVAPDTPAWKAWLTHAEEKSKSGDQQWFHDYPSEWEKYHPYEIFDEDKNQESHFQGMLTVCIRADAKKQHDQRQSEASRIIQRPSDRNLPPQHPLGAAHVARAPTL